MKDRLATSDWRLATGKAVSRACARASGPVRYSLFAVRSAFTLIELLVVIAIIAIIAALAIPAVGPMISSNHQTEAVNTLGSLLATAQTAAQKHGTPVGLRIERVCETFTAPATDSNTGQTSIEPFTQMVRDAQGNAKWLSYQQASFYVFARTKTGVFERMNDLKITRLPDNAWVAPDYALQPDTATFSARSLAESDVTQAKTTTASPDPTGYTLTSFNRLENFFIVFDQAGALMLFSSDDLVFADPLQFRLKQNPDPTPPREPIAYPLRVKHPDNSARGLLLYDREQYNAIAREDGAARLAFFQKARTLLINRNNGAIVEGRAP